MTRILIVRLSAIGDVLHATTVVTTCAACCQMLSSPGS